MTPTRNLVPGAAGTGWARLGACARRRRNEASRACISTSSSTSCPTSIRPRPRTGSSRSTRSSSRPARPARRFLVYKLLKRARQLQIGLPPLTQTRYINTISPEQEPTFPGDEAMELRIRRIIRWNAVAMVLRANSQFAGIGGHLSTYASSASLYEVGFNHFFRGKDGAGERRPDLLPGPRGPGHLRPGVPRGPPDRGPARPLPARVDPGQGGPELVPAPAPDARLLGVPDGLDGPRADQRHLPGALQPLPAQPRHPGHQRRPASGRSWATARPTSRSRSARSTSPPARASTT